MSAGLILGGIGALLSGAGSVYGAASAGNMNNRNRKWQEKMYKQQRWDNEKAQQRYWRDVKNYAQWSYDNFESPSAQRAAMMAAGTNPYFQDGVIQPMSPSQGGGSAASPASVPSDGPYQNNPASNIMAGASSLAAAGMQFSQMKNIDAQTQLTDAQRLKTLAETKGIDQQNSLFEITKATLESDLLSKRFKNVLEQVQADLAEVNALEDLDQKRARTAEIWSSYEKNLSAAAKTDADRLTVDMLRDGAVRAQEAGIALTEAQTATEGSKQANLLSGARYQSALASISEKEAAYAVEKAEAEIRRINADILSERERRDLLNAQAELADIQRNHERGGYAEFLRRVATTGNSIWSIILPKIISVGK